MRAAHFLISFLGAVSATVATMTKETLLQAMKDASAKMAMFEGDYTLIVQGGAVNVILGNRKETGDMDFVATNYDPTKGKDCSIIPDELERALEFAHRSSMWRLKPIPDQWFDKTVCSFFLANVNRFNKYVAEAKAQAVVLSEDGIDPEDGKGIRYIAAPWDWQFTSKLHNVRQEKPYDLDDAAFYLEKWLQRNNKESIQFDAVKGLFAPWGYEVPENLAGLCKEVNKSAKKDIITGTIA